MSRAAYAKYPRGGTLYTTVRDLLGHRIQYDAPQDRVASELEHWVEDLLLRVVVIERFPVTDGKPPAPWKASEHRIYCHACKGTWVGEGEPERKHPTHLEEVASDCPLAGRKFLL